MQAGAEQVLPAGPREVNLVVPNMPHSGPSEGRLQKGTEAMMSRNKS